MAESDRTSKGALVEVPGRLPAPRGTYGIVVTHPLEAGSRRLTASWDPRDAGVWLVGRCSIAVLGYKVVAWIDTEEASVAAWRKAGAVDPSVLELEPADPPAESDGFWDVPL